MWGTAARLLLLFFPAFIGRLFSLIKALYNWKSYVTFFRKIGRFEKCSLIIQCLYLSLNIYLLIRPTKSYYAITSTSIFSPSYMVRNRFRQYVEERTRTEPLFLEMIQIRNIHANETVSSDDIWKTFSDHTALELEYVALERLSLQLRNNEKRKDYTLFGEEILKCDYCEKSSYLKPLLLAPSILFEYLIFFCLLGLVTIFEKKARWRMVCCLVMTFIITYEIYVWSYSEDLVIEILNTSKEHSFYTRPEQMNYVRHLIITVCVVLITLFDAEVQKSTVSISLSASIRNIESSIAKLQASRLARTCVMIDDTLRRNFWDHYQKIDQERQHLFNDPEYKRQYAELARKYKVNFTETENATGVRNRKI